MTSHDTICSPTRSCGLLYPSYRCHRSCSKITAISQASAPEHLALPWKRLPNQSVYEVIQGDIWVDIVNDFIGHLKPLFACIEGRHFRRRIAPPITSSTEGNNTRGRVCRAIIHDHSLDGQNCLFHDRLKRFFNEFLFIASRTDQDVWQELCFEPFSPQNLLRNSCQGNDSTIPKPLQRNCLRRLANDPVFPCSY